MMILESLVLTLGGRDYFAKAEWLLYREEVVGHRHLCFNSFLLSLLLQLNGLGTN